MKQCSSWLPADWNSSAEDKIIHCHTAYRQEFKPSQWWITDFMKWRWIPPWWRTSRHHVRNCPTLKRNLKISMAFRMQWMALKMGSLKNYQRTKFIKQQWSALREFLTCKMLVKLNILKVSFSLSFCIFTCMLDSNE